MSIRRRGLPRGWYPDDPGSVRSLVSSWTGEGSASPPGRTVSAVAPHAGWAFSGPLAAVAAASLGPGIAAGASTLVVFGGHLPPGARPLAAGESAYDSPMGPLTADLELLEALRSSLARDSSVPIGLDEDPDNTVEVLLPIVAALYPGIRVLWLRAPNDESAIALGGALFDAASSLGRGVVCLGSTDLTHYGPNYGFTPKGKGRAAADWVRGTNDRRFIDALLAMDASEALRRGGSERSACSPGAAAAALSFARRAGAVEASLLDYSTSLEVRPDESFVGYAAIAFYAK